MVNFKVHVSENVKDELIHTYKYVQLKKIL